MSKILLVDDSRTDRAHLEAQLMALGYCCISTEGGAKALEQLAASDDISGIVCDLSMPGMDGTAFVEKARAAGCGLPIVMLSGTARHDAVVASRRAGANGWLVKPCCGRDVLHSLRELEVSMAPPKR